MAQLHISEAELARDPHGTLEKVRHGDEVIVEQDHRPVARITPMRGPGRPIAECIAIAEARGSKALLDDQFSRDLQEIITSQTGGEADTATLDLLSSWQEQDATGDPTQIRAAEQEIADFKKARNEARALLGAPPIYP